MEQDGETVTKEETSTEMKQKQLVCYFTVLGQIWPEQSEKTQGIQ